MTAPADPRSHPFAGPEILAAFDPAVPLAGALTPPASWYRDPAMAQ
ncbi:hypothetical protein [Allorhizocola rhizosphaerae]|nr:hypothetical protein [Allorhizocola rhizosphaerae]